MPINTLMLTLAVLGQLLLAAHALRRGELALCAALAALPLLLLTRRGAARLVCACALVLGAVLWVDAGIGFVRLRLALGQDWLRLALILSGLTLASLSAGLWLLGRRAQELFPRGREVELPQAAAFLLTAGLLSFARAKASVPLLLADRFLPGSGWLEILALALYAAWLAGAFMEPQRHKQLRPRVWALFSAVFFGQLILGLLGLQDFLMTGRLHLPVPALILAGPIFRDGGLFMATLFAATVLFVGPAWCSHLCYIGAWDDACSRLNPKRPEPLPARWTLYGRAATLALTCGTALALRLLGVNDVTATWLAAAFGLAGVGVMLAASRRLGVMAHCTAFCPIGLLGNLLGRLVPWRLRIDRETCSRCRSCSRVCRYSALSGADIEAGAPSLSCTLCGDCIGACPHDAMHYHFPGLTRHTARATFLTLVATLSAVFLGVARM
ncbi:MAG: 4Fe-4S binding protein [Humidesulfovibrio sp.]|nr:4Fe-4S binding protein [Humidesulfovibrio sp.]